MAIRARWDTVPRKDSSLAGVGLGLDYTLNRNVTATLAGGFALTDATYTKAGDFKPPGPGVRQLLDLGCLMNPIVPSALVVGRPKARHLAACADAIFRKLDMRCV